MQSTCLKKERMKSAANQEDNSAVFECRVCGTTFSTLKEANKCEMICLKDKEKEDVTNQVAEIETALKENSLKTEEVKEKIEKLEKELDSLDEELENLEKQGYELAMKKWKIQNKADTKYIVNNKEVSSETFDNAINNFVNKLFNTKEW